MRQTRRRAVMRIRRQQNEDRAGTAGAAPASLKFSAAPPDRRAAASFAHNGRRLKSTHNPHRPPKSMVCGTICR